jgi:hypothetical protein
VNTKDRISSIWSLLDDVSTTLDQSKIEADRKLAHMLTNWMFELKGFQEGIRDELEDADLAKKALVRSKMRVIDGGRCRGPPDEIEPEHAQ